MFVPTFEALLKLIGLSENEYAAKDEVVLSKPVFEMLATILSLAQNFDEEWYLSYYPDVASAVAAGTTSAHGHFIRYGYFEGRQPAASVVDEHWYLDRYADVAEAVAAGDVVSGSEHYAHTGAMEWRAPNPATLDLVASWRDLGDRTPPAAADPRQ